jgi:hypothetical protein
MKPKGAKGDPSKAGFSWGIEEWIKAVNPVCVTEHVSGKFNPATGKRQSI